MATAKKGIGRSPLGVGPYGYGTPATASLPKGIIHSATSGVPEGSLMLSDQQGTRGQYVFDANGRRVGTPNVRHMVSLAFRTVRGSSVVDSIGHRFGEVRVVGDNFAAEQTARVNEAVKDLVDAGYVRVDSVAVVPGNGLPSLTRVRLVDLTNKEPFELDL